MGKVEVEKTVVGLEEAGSGWAGLKKEQDWRRLGGAGEAGEASRLDGCRTRNRT